MAKLLALDLSTHTGWARFNGRAPPRFGTIVLEGPDMPWKHGQFLVWLEDAYFREPFEALAWERPLKLPTDDVPLLVWLIGLVGIASAFAGKHKLRWCDVDVKEAKKALTNKQNATKEEMLWHAERGLGWQVRDHHQADAGAVGGVAYGRLFPKQGAIL